MKTVRNVVEVSSSASMRLNTMSDSSIVKDLVKADMFGLHTRLSADDMVHTPIIEDLSRSMIS